MTDFSKLVKEAFIDPLRSVLIVDDEYPTWEEVLNSHFDKTTQNEGLEARSQAKPWRVQPEGPKKVIDEFRKVKPGFVIDIHDALASSSGTKDEAEPGRESPIELANHLHQSDLLILDYNLEGASSGGKTARELLRTTLTNNHFNLIIVHTGEADLETVMSECLISLMQSCTSTFADGVINSLNELDGKLDDLEIAEEFDRRQLEHCFTMTEYLAIRHPSINESELTRQFMKAEGQLSELNRLGQQVGLKGRELRLFLYWTIRQFEKNHLDEFSEETLKGLVWEIDDPSKWLRTSKGFVSFVKKGQDNLLQKLQNALENWKPTPSRLLSAKYRHVLNTIGIEAEDDSLLKSHVFAQFYNQICESPGQGVSEQQADLLRAFKLKNHVSRQSESISFLIEDEIINFGKRIVAADNASGDKFKTHYGIDLEDEQVKKDAVTRYNHYVSTLPLMKSQPHQLDCGHIFKIGGDWWVCATPACDLQPGQNSIAFIGNCEELRPFTALRLEKVKSNHLSGDHINSGSYCFVEENEKIIALGLRPLNDEAKPSTQKVTWRTFVAKDAGLITNGILHVYQFELNSGQVQTNAVEATLIAKLRYEYALNYIQRIGTSVSRIGLDYSA
ncbi:hypothetical protein CWE21_06895 [Pseudidiomarina aquimaris]|uniref:Response receiver domain-containing protein n=1 Tax=Pseudidiomarina aquimaris TaxID=641841 RepID=A0A432XI52_9GAMM|nr:response regulator receiver domain [Pseudidiomarina aquimaris]RUO48267.1 hypothetical protein CWE21_06895 [Pseudidiomarina aquimaris]